jgi:hypothetical protein
MVVEGRLHITALELISSVLSLLPLYLVELSSSRNPENTRENLIYSGARQELGGSMTFCVDSVQMSQW